MLKHLRLEPRLMTEVVSAIIQETQADAGVCLQRLVETGLIESRGEKKGNLSPT